MDSVFELCASNDSNRDRLARTLAEVDRYREHSCTLLCKSFGFEMLRHLICAWVLLPPLSVIFILVLSQQQRTSSLLHTELSLEKRNLHCLITYAIPLIDRFQNQVMSLLEEKEASDRRIAKLEEEVAMLKLSAK